MGQSRNNFDQEYFHPAGRWENDERRNNYEKYSTNGRVDVRGFNQQKFQPYDKRDKESKGRDQEYFHPAGRNGNGKKDFVQNDYLSAAKRAHQHGENVQQAGYGNRDSGNRNPNIRNVQSQQDGRGLPDRNIQSQKDGRGMPDMVKEYLLKTLMEQGNRRY